MWSDNARQASIAVRRTANANLGGGGGGGAIRGGGGGGGNIAARGAALQRGLQEGGAMSRGQWGRGGKGTQSHVTITGQKGLGMAHQTGINSMPRGMDAGNQSSAYPGVNPKVADNAYATGPRGYRGASYESNVARNATAKAPGVRGFGLDDYT